MADEGLPPTSANALLDLLAADLRDVSGKLELMNAMFGEEAARTTLDEVGGGFFRVFQEVLEDDIVLAVARLTDPPETGRGKGAKPNATLRRLADLVSDTNTCVLDDDFEQRLGELEVRCDALKTHRNKRLAHADLATRVAAVRPAKTPSQLFNPALATFGITEIEAAVDLAREFVTVVSVRLRGTSVDCSAPQHLREAARSMLDALTSLAQSQRKDDRLCEPHPAIGIK